MAKRVDKVYIEKLRQEIRKKHANATKKASRLRQKGVEINFSGHDPRANARNIAKYTARQLIAYGKRLDEFNSRTNQFVPGAHGQPLPRKMFEQYKRLEQQNNRIAAERMAKRGKFNAPGSGMTIEERNVTMVSKVKTRGSASNRPFSEIDRKSTEINGVEGLTRLIKNLNKKLDKKFLPKEIKAQRKQLGEMLTTIGNHDLIEKAKKLTDDQFDVLFNDTKFANDVSLQYYVVQMQASNSKERWYASVIEDNFSDINNALEWAATLPKTI